MALLVAYGSFSTDPDGFVGRSMSAAVESAVNRCRWHIVFYELGVLPLVGALFRESGLGDFRGDDKVGALTHRVED